MVLINLATELGTNRAGNTESENYIRAKNRQLFCILNICALNYDILRMGEKERRKGAGVEKNNL